MVSDKVPEEPKKSGCLFEKSLIERHISDFGKCPVTGEPLTLDDIVSVKAGKIVKPGPEQAASIPGTSGMIQKETERPRKRPKLEHDKFDWDIRETTVWMLCEENHEAGVAHFLEHLLLRASVEAANLSLLSDVSVPQNHHEVTQTYTEFSFQFHSKLKMKY